MSGTEMSYFNVVYWSVSKMSYQLMISILGMVLSYLLMISILGMVFLNLPIRVYLNFQLF